MIKNKKIFLAGHNGLVGSAVLRLLKKKKFKKIFTVNRKKLDLRDQAKVQSFLKKNKFESIIICAAKVGGIKANSSKPADFLYDNLQIQNNLINGAHINNIKNLIFLGSSCIYPKLSKQPIKENYLLTGPLEQTNQAYAIAKIAGLQLCQSYNYQFKTNYKCLMPCNLFGPNDNYNLNTSHFLPAIIKKIYLAKKNNKKILKFWGNGLAKRELMFVDDLAEGIIYFLNKKTNSSFINIGNGYEQNIKTYIEIVAKKINFKGKIKFNNDPNMNGMPRKILSSVRARQYGWKPRYSFTEGLDLTLLDFYKNKSKYLKM